LVEVVRCLNADPATDLMYSDEDKIDLIGRRSWPAFKPGFDADLLCGFDYLGHLVAIRTSVVKQVGGFRSEADGAQDWDLVLKVTERARAVLHVPRVLYHWRGLETSTAGAGEEAKPWAFEAGKRAIQAHCRRIGLEAVVERDQDDPGVYHLEPRLESQPRVSIVIPTAGQMREVRYEELSLVVNCVRSILGRSTYENYEIVVVSDEKTPEGTIDELRALAGDRLRVVSHEGEFNFSARINAGAVCSEGEHLLFLNDDIEVATPNWIERMVMYSSLPEIGAVGGRLLLEDGRLQHAGVGFEGGLPGHPYYGYPGDGPGYANAVKIARNLLAVTGACLMTRRELFEQVGGLSTTLPVNYNDVDYCLKLRDGGQRVVYDPDLVMYHFESSSRSSAVEDWEKQFLLERWSATTEPDPYSNPHLREGLPELHSAFLWALRRPPKLGRLISRSRSRS